jgi:membrane protease YdiL (CAAX protease family)
MVVTSATVSFGHSTRVVEASHNEILAVTLGPIVEEICLRGLLMPLIARVVGPRGAVIATGALFAILHWPASPLKLASIWLTGVAYGSIRARSGSTAFAATAHATYNMTVLLFDIWT